MNEISNIEPLWLGPKPIEVVTTFQQRSDYSIMSLQTFNPKIKEATILSQLKNLSARLTVCIKVSLTDLSKIKATVPTDPLTEKRG